MDGGLVVNIIIYYFLQKKEGNVGKEEEYGIGLKGKGMEKRMNVVC